MDEILELEDVDEVIKLFDKKEKGEMMCIGSITETIQNSDIAKIKLVITSKQDNTLVRCSETIGEVKFMLPENDEYKAVNIERKEKIDSITQKIDKRKTELYGLFEKKGFKVLFGIWSNCE